MLNLLRKRYIHTDKEFISDPVAVGALLMFSSGFMDAYSYTVRDKVFANAQTGNVVLFAISLMKREYRWALHYLGPILVCIIGVFMTSYVRKILHQRDFVYWKHVVLAIEIVLLFAVSNISTGYNTIANMCISMACAMQMNTFNNFSDVPITSTVCTGNLRSATDALCDYMHTKNKKSIKKARLNYIFVAIFATGAAIGAMLTSMYRITAIRIPMWIMILCFILLFQGNYKDIDKGIDRKSAK